jgi:hypothetical protein
VDWERWRWVLAGTPVTWSYCCSGLGEVEVGVGSHPSHVVLLFQWTGRAGGGCWLAPQSRRRLQAGGGGCQDPPRQADLPIIQSCGTGC